MCMHLKIIDKEICQVCILLNHNTMHIGGESVCEHNALQCKPRHCVTCKASMGVFLFVCFGMKVLPQGHELEVLNPQDPALLGIRCRRPPIALSI